MLGSPRDKDLAQGVAFLIAGLVMVISGFLLPDFATWTRGFGTRLGPTALSVIGFVILVVGVWWVTTSRRA